MAISILNTCRTYKDSQSRIWYHIHFSPVIYIVEKVHMVRTNGFAPFALLCYDTLKVNEAVFDDPTNWRLRCLDYMQLLDICRLQTYIARSKCTNWVAHVHVTLLTAHLMGLLLKPKDKSSQVRAKKATSGRLHPCFFASSSSFLRFRASLSWKSNMVRTYEQYSYSNFYHSCCCAGLFLNDFEPHFPPQSRRRRHGHFILSGCARAFRVKRMPNE